jgi:hypothetical protein
MEDSGLPLNPQSIIIEPELSDSDQSEVSECTVTLEELQGKPKLTAREKQIMKKLTKKCEPSKKQMEHTERMRQKAYEKARERRRIEAEYPALKQELEELKTKYITLTQPKQHNKVEQKQESIQILPQSKSNNFKMKSFQW